MTKHITALCATGLLGLVLAGCGTSGSTDQTGSTATSSSQAASSGAHNAADVQFSQLMIPHHRQAVTMAGLATTRAASPKVKALATAIDRAQGPEITKMTGWLKSWGESVPSGSSMGGMDMGNASMPGMMSTKDMTDLKSLTGAAFDARFLTMMISHHQGAITMARQEQKTGKDTAATALAKSIAASQTAQITTMRNLLKTH